MLKISINWNLKSYKKTKNILTSQHINKHFFPLSSTIKKKKQKWFSNLSKSSSPEWVKISNDPILNQDFATRSTTAPGKETFILA